MADIQVAGNLDLQGNKIINSDLNDAIDRRSTGGVWALTRDTGFDVEYTDVEEADHDTIATSAGWDHFSYTDLHGGGFMRDAGGTMRFVCPGDGRWNLHPLGMNHDPANPYQTVVTTPSENNLFGLPHTTGTVSGVPTNYDWCSGGPIVDCGNGIGFVVLHIEDRDARDAGNEFWDLDCGIIELDENGEIVSFDYLGPLHRHEMTKAESISNDYSAWAASGVLIDYSHIDGYVYMGTVDHSMPSTSGYSINRCLKSDIIAATLGATPSVPDFRKWNGETLEEEWTESALGGSWTAFDNGKLGTYFSNGGDAVVLPDGRIIVGVVNSYADSGTHWVVGYGVADDPLDMNVQEPTILIDQTEFENIYGNMWTGDPNSPRLVTREDVHLHYVSANPSNRWGTNTIRKLSLKPVAPSIEVPSDAEITALAEAASEADITALKAEDDPFSQYQGTGAYVSVAAGFGGPEISDLTGYLPGLVIAVGTHTITLPPAADRPGSVWQFINATVGAGQELTIAVQSGDQLSGVEDATLTCPENTIIHWVSNGDGWIPANGSANAIGFTGASSGLSATNVQAAIDEIVSEGVGGASALADLTDVDVDTDAPEANDVLAWDAGEEKWTPATLLNEEEPVATMGIVPDSRLSIQATYGTPAFDWDNLSTVTSSALPLGEGFLAYGSKVNRVDLRRALFTIAATNLTAGQNIELVCYNLDDDHLPGTLAWKVTITVGTSTGAINHDIGASSGLFLPDGGYWIGFWNPSTNAGTITFNNYYPANRAVSANNVAGSLDRYAALRGPSATTAPADLSNFDINSAPNTSSRLGINLTAPGIWLR